MLIWGSMQVLYFPPFPVSPSIYGVAFKRMFTRGCQSPGPKKTTSKFSELLFSSSNVLVNNISTATIVGSRTQKPTGSFITSLLGPWICQQFVFNLCEETISRTDEGQPRPKYIFYKCGTNIYFFTLQRFGPSPSPNFKCVNRFPYSLDVLLHNSIWISSISVCLSPP